MTTVKIAGIKTKTYETNPGWVPETNLVLTPTTVKNLQKILYPLNQGNNLLLVGDAGVGKNALIYYINQLRSHPTIRYSFNEDTLPDDLVGAYKIEPQSHSFIWSDGPLSHALRLGGTFVADEMNLAPPEVLKRFYSVFTDGYLQLLEGDASIIKAAPGFNFVATQNPAEGFEGRKNLPREIQKYFATVYIDNYPHAELVEILRGLYSYLSPDLLERLVRINDRVEQLIVQRKIGTRDLERYHFNLRNLNRLAIRLADDPDNLVPEVRDIFQKPFRTPEEQGEVETVIVEELSVEKDGTMYSIPADADEIPINVDSAAQEFQIGRSDLKGQKNADTNGAGFESTVKATFTDFPPVKTRRKTLEAIGRAIQKGENVLLESDSDVEPERYFDFFAKLMNQEMTVITLSRGMHTADILGGLKPKSDVVMDEEGHASDAVQWVDGPLTAAVRRGDFILLKGLEAAGPELVEKLNMLTDDARALALPPESGSMEPIRLKEHARVFGVKYHRNQRSTPTISRAFRNRFTAINVTPIVDKESLIEIVAAHLGMEEEFQMVTSMVDFHTLIRERSHKREIGGGNLQPYHFGLTNLLRWCEHIVHSVSTEDERPDLNHVLMRGAGISYINEISDPVEREKVAALLDTILKGLDLEDALEKLTSGLKKKIIKSRIYDKKISWDQKEHWRKANTGKAKLKMEGREMKDGLNIDTPETGGKIKEGADAWYGEDTMGNEGQGDPGAGGGAWGYRNEELYEAFLKKRKILWDYNVGVSLEDFKETFGPEIERVNIDFDQLLDPKVDIHRRYQQQGSRLDARRYLSYLAGKGDGRIFDHTAVEVEDDKLKGVEIVFALNKGRRIFNFEYSISTLVALMSASTILDNHKIDFGICGYSDLDNDKRSVDLVWYNRLEQDYGMNEEEQLWEGITDNWHGDTIPEYQILDELTNSFTPGARTRILVLMSDFRGARCKRTWEMDLNSDDTIHMKQALENMGKRGIVTLGVGLGPRTLSQALFSESIEVAAETYANLPSLTASKLSELIHRHHNAAVL